MTWLLADVEMARFRKAIQTDVGAADCDRISLHSHGGRVAGRRYLTTRLKRSCMVAFTSAAEPAAYEQKQRPDVHLDSYLNIAEAMLRDARRPLTAMEILELAYTSEIVPSQLHGKTQHKTMGARLSEDILLRRERSTFFRTVDASSCGSFLPTRRSPISTVPR